MRLHLPLGPAGAVDSSRRTRGPFAIAHRPLAEPPADSHMSKEVQHDRVYLHPIQTCPRIPVVPRVGRNRRRHGVLAPGVALAFPLTFPRWRPFGGRASRRAPVSIHVHTLVGERSGISGSEPSVGQSAIDLLCGGRRHTMAGDVDVGKCGV